MAEDVDDGAAEPAEDGEPVENPAARRLRPRLAAIIAAAVVAIIVAGSGIFYLVSSGDDEQASATIDLGGPLVYHALPEFLVDLQPDGNTRHHIKLQIVAEIPENHVPRITAQEVAVVDAVLAYLREQNHAELTGEAGAERLRSELLAVINGKIAPAQVRTILFKGFLMS